MKNSRESVAKGIENLLDYSHHKFDTLLWADRLLYKLTLEQFQLREQKGFFSMTNEMFKCAYKHVIILKTRDGRRAHVSKPPKYGDSYVNGFIMNEKSVEMCVWKIDGMSKSDTNRGEDIIGVHSEQVGAV